MKRVILFILVFMAVILTGLRSAPAQQVLYGANGAAGNLASLMIIDPDTAQVQRVIGPIGYSVTGLAFAPDGTLYGVTTCKDPNCPRCLIRIDTETGAGTVIGDMGNDADDNVADISFSPAGVLYGWAEPSYDDLVTIDTTTGTATLVGDSNLSTFGSGLAFAPDGTLYLAGDGDNGNFYTIDPTTGLPTGSVTLDGMQDYSIGGLAVNESGTIYGARKLSWEGGPVNDLITIDPITGHITSIGIITYNGKPVEHFDSIAFSPPPPAAPTAVPTLSQWGMIILSLLLAGIAIFVLRRRLHVS